ncbi:MAG: glycosyltransferase family 4 protein [Candidatus Binatia bacterium]
MRIAYVHYMAPESARGGMGVHIANSTDALERIGHEVHVVRALTGDGATSPGPGAGSRDRGGLRRMLAKYGYEARALYRGRASVRRDLAEIRAIVPDVLIVRYEPFAYGMWAVARRLRLPLVVEVNATARELVQWKRDQVCVYPGTRYLEARILRGADRLFTVSTILKEDLVAYYGIAPERIGVVPNGADVERFHPGVDGGRVRARHGLGTAPVVGFLGSFGRWHDIGLIGAAAQVVCQSHPEVRVLMAGATRESLPPQLAASFEPLGDRVVFTGVVPIAEAPEYVAAMDVALTVFPAIPRFGPSVIKQFEYMAAGRAVVATDIGQQGEIIRDGENGLLVPPGDVDALVRAIETLLVDGEFRRRLGSAARQTIVEGYTWRHNARRVEALCREAQLECEGRP